VIFHEYSFHRCEVRIIEYRVRRIKRVYSLSGRRNRAEPIA
jgi:hypothetical protein